MSQRTRMITLSLNEKVPLPDFPTEPGVNSAHRVHTSDPAHHSDPLLSTRHTFLSANRQARSHLRAVRNSFLPLCVSPGASLGWNPLYSLLSTTSSRTSLPCYTGDLTGVPATQGQTPRGTSPCLILFRIPCSAL